MERVMTMEAERDEALIVWWEDLDEGAGPGDLLPALDEFADRFLDGGHLTHPVEPGVRVALRAWRQVGADVDLGRQVGFETADVVANRNDIHPGDVLMVCERRREGREAARVLAACGYDSLHLFGDDRADRVTSRERIAAGAPGVRGCRPDELAIATARRPVRELVIGLGTRDDSRQRFHDCVASVASGDGGVVQVTVLCADPELAHFGVLLPTSARPAATWAAPCVTDRVAGPSPTGDHRQRQWSDA